MNSSLYPIDGGVIEIEYNSEKNNIFNLDFNNISTSWTILTALDIFNFDNKKTIPTSKSNILEDLEINKYNNSLKERIDFINELIEKNYEPNDKFNLKKYLTKFRSRYNANIKINGDIPLNYEINAKLKGYIDSSRDDYINNKEEFSIELVGGLLRGEGELKVEKLPLSTANIFLSETKDFQGGLDMHYFII